jgi:hypothetical protein
VRLTQVLSAAQLLGVEAPAFVFDNQMALFCRRTRLTVRDHRLRRISCCGKVKKQLTARNAVALRGLARLCKSGGFLES